MTDPDPPADRLADAIRDIERGRVLDKVLIVVALVAVLCMAVAAVLISLEASDRLDDIHDDLAMLRAQHDAIARECPAP